MKKAMMGKKLGMTQIIAEDGKVTPVTVIEVGPGYISQIKTEEKDGYNSIQVAMEELRPKKVTKPIEGHFKKANLRPMKYISEFKLSDISEYKIGDKLDSSIFTEGEFVDIQGVTRGKGFQGNVKRHGTTIGKMTHGSKFHRGTGSIGSSATPSKVIKGKKMPGHMGVVTVTMQNLEIIKVDNNKNVIMVKGSIPGPKKAVVKIKSTVKKQI